jgi:hypothetical protein
VDWQLWLTLALIATAAAYLAWCGWRSWRSARKGCAGGCGCHKASAAVAADTTLISAEALTLRKVSRLAESPPNRE